MRINIKLRGIYTDYFFKYQEEMRKMKLLFLIDHFYKGGAETSLLNLLKCLSSGPYKYEIDFMIMDQRPVEKAISLIDQIPSAVHVLNIWKRQKNASVFYAAYEKLFLSEEDKLIAPAAAHLYVRKREYDWAFHVGEWWSPAFLSLKIKAKRKGVWIHSDLTKAITFNPDTFFMNDQEITDYIFVSQTSMNSCTEKFPFVREKSRCIYNILDVPKIRQMAGETVEENYFNTDIPVIVTCANIREEKNHERQLQAMAILKRRGIDFLWLNIGNTSEEDRCNGLVREAKALGLGDRFILTGARENPYKYIARARAVAVLSDYESWSLVITEAKILGVPVIATKTSGALEQLKHGETGILTNFTAIDIADKLESFFRSSEIEGKLKQNLENCDNTEEILESIYTMLREQQVKARPAAQQLLYVIDDINGAGGAHVATKLQILAFLSEGKQISVFSSSIPSAATRAELNGVSFLGWRDLPADRLFHRRWMECLMDKNLTKYEKNEKVKMTWEGKIKRNQNVFSEMVLPKLSDIFSGFDTVCVMSEGSGFRELVATCQARRKVQWIHTDYCDWKDKTEWTKQITKDDGEIYKHFDKIVVLTPEVQNAFLGLYPHLSGKVVVNRNLIPVEKIRDRARKSVKDPTLLKFVTVGRIDQWKAYDRLFDVLEQLFQEGYRFYWTIVGWGEDFNRINALFENSEFADYVELTGHRSNPYSFMKEADVFALFSKYEGLPNTIFEALILGTPVIATNVGGVSQQIQDGKTGWLVENNTDGIYHGLKNILDHPEQVAQAKTRLTHYQYDNNNVLRTAKSILFEE